MRRLSALDPGKQGLKHETVGEFVVSERLSALDPGKQGLKPVTTPRYTLHIELSALDPGKQGLKPNPVGLGLGAISGFQRLIQENKD